MNVRRFLVSDAVPVPRSRHGRRVLAVHVMGLTLAAAALAGCGPSGDQAPAAAGTSASTAPGSGAGSGAGSGRVDDCLAGSWSVDVAALATQAASLMRNGGGIGTAEGTITVTFADTLTIHYANTFTLVSQTSGMKVGVKDSYAGDAVSSDYTAKNGKIVGTMSGQSVTKTTAVIVADKVQPATSGAIAGTLDLSNGLTSYTCSAGSATLNNGTVTWKLTRA